MTRKKVYIPEKRCTVCETSYDSGRSDCPNCGTPNTLFESASFVKFPIEMERALYRAIEGRSKKAGRTIEEFIIAALEQEVSRLNHQ